MKIKSGFELRNVCGENVVFSTSVSDIDYTKLNILNNETSVFIFNLLLDNDLTLEELVEKTCDSYDVDATTAHNDIEKFCNDLRKAGVLAE